MSNFSDPKAIVDYAENASRRIPGLKDMHRMSALLMAESTPPDGRVLVLGAGGGMELKSFAQSFPGWRFDGVDPSAEMLGLAKAALGPLASRVQLHHGYVEAAPQGPFDAASCLLTLHFTDEAERYRILCELRARLKPGGAFVAMHYSVSQDRSERDLALRRCAVYAISSGVDPEQARAATAAIGKQLPILAPEQDEELMRRAGFSGISTFYSGLAFRGWVAHA
ncbi:class I SAM-dependent methyltransferase [Paucibacter sp. PLA-PC-4]|uniref:class I SAM-dependent methyltransferase n=1 Tax=Paucibacter sp. PLA-PC-4 TaxID=2993655 RepID=UPI002248C1EC|nr:class I SAM-dependent methyltransferase [Paucibacter sp. PLA-PC-4]MCX2861978.1 class I SAM-dependent methyltransferase [Paucibacter sp. PLA-PC-4]